MANKSHKSWNMTAGPRTKSSRETNVKLWRFESIWFEDEWNVMFGEIQSIATSLPAMHKCTLRIFFITLKGVWRVLDKSQAGMKNFISGSFNRWQVSRERVTIRREIKQMRFEAEIICKAFQRPTSISPVISTNVHSFLKLLASANCLFSIFIFLSIEME